MLEFTTDLFAASRSCRGFCPLCENAQIVDLPPPGSTLKVSMLRSRDHDSGCSIFPGSARISNSAEPLPSAFCQNTELRSPSRFDVKTMRCPSGVHVGRLLSLPPKVKRRADADPVKS